MLNGRTNLRLFMGREIVEDDNIAGSQRRHQHLLNVGAERGRVDRAIEDGRRGQLRRAQRCDDRVRLPMTARRVIGDARTPQTARVAA